MKIYVKKFIILICFFALLVLLIGCIPADKYQSASEAAFQKGVQQYKSNNPIKRLKSLKYFEEAGDNRTVGYIIKALDDKDVFVRCAAIDSLIKVEKIKSVDYITKKLSDSDKRVVNKAEAALKSFGDEIVPALTHSILTTNKNFQPNIIKAMGIVPKEDFIDILGRIVIDENDHKLRIEAINALAMYKDPVAKAYIEKGFNDRIAMVKITALEKVPKNNDPALVNLISPLLSVSNQLVVEAAINALAQNRNDTAVLPLLDKLRNLDLESDNKTRDQIANALTQVGSDRSGEIYVEALNDPLQIVRYSVLKAAIDSKDTNWGKKVILNAVNNDMSDIRSMAILALKETNSKLGISELLNALNDYDSQVRINAITTLSGLPNADAYKDQFVNMLSDNDPKVRITTINALGNTKSIWAFEILKKLLATSNDEETTIATIYSLGNYQNNIKVTKVLQGYLTNSNSKIADASANALVNMGSTWARSALTDTISVDSKEVRLRVIKALGTMGNYASVGVLQQYQNDPDTEISSATKLALESIVKRKQIKDSIYSTKLQKK